MKTDETRITVGVDVSKHRLDVFEWGGRCSAFDPQYTNSGVNGRRPLRSVLLPPSISTHTTLDSAEKGGYISYSPHTALPPGCRWGLTCRANGKDNAPFRRGLFV